MFTRNLSYIAAFALFLGVIVLCESSAYAQYDSYTGRSAPLSPWLGLTQRSTGPLPSYYQYVKPALEVQNRLNQQQQQLSRQAIVQQQQGLAQQQIMLRDVMGSSTTGAGRGVRPPGITGQVHHAASFRNFQQYYPPGLVRRPN